MKTWLLDTNAIIYARNNVGGVRERLNLEAATGKIATSTLVIGELVFGASISARREVNLRRIDELLETLHIVPVTIAVARRFGELKADLRGRGLTKGDIDLLLAATAIESEATLVTNDGALLARDIPGLESEDWT